MRKWTFFSLGLTCALCACARGSSSTPEEAYAGFTKAAAQGDTEATFAALSAQSQADLKARSAALSSTLSGSAQLEPALLLFPSLARAPSVTEVKRMGSDSGVADLQVTTSEGTGVVRMVHEGAGWRVDLRELLK